MTLNETLLAEFKHEAATTRKILERVPLDKGDYKPHEKSMTLMRLATHVAEIAGWWKECLVHDELDFAKGDFTPKVFHSSTELLTYFDDLVAKAEVILNETPETEFANDWTMRQGEMIFFTMPKAQVVRTWCLNHWYHHRAQLGVYLRMLDIAVPGSYGPSADDQG
ncbi:MAG: DinB family protein [Bacteroidetes bacterium]|nr:DinB family protein [Bacteroidota bacterium]MBP6314629.1 DinB family protein [Chitinophagaceae bacterium]